MARPRKDDAGASAAARIEAAFWRLLEEVGYDGMTVRRIAQESGVNRNSFYYHYESLEDLAVKAFRNNAEAEESKALVAMLIGAFDGYIPSGAVLPRARRVMLCARSESPFIRRMVVELLRDEWFATLSIDADRLSVDERVQSQFIFSGLAAVLGGHEAADMPLALPRLADSSLGKAAIDTLKAMSAAQVEMG